MALDVYWKNYQAQAQLGSLAIDEPLEALLDAFSQQVGFPVDPYGKARLYPGQWQQLIRLASSLGYPTDELRRVQVAIPVNEPQGLLVLQGD